MPKLVNRAKMTTATTGTGTLTLGSAVDGYQTFANAGVVNADVVRYVIEDNSNWEIGTGTYTATGTTLSRTPSQSSSGGSAINLSGAAQVFITAVVADIVQPDNNLSDLTSAATARTNLGLGTIATQAANSVSITGGSISGITDLAVADGGTGASSFTANNVLLGNNSASFQTVAPGSSGNVLTSNGTTWVSQAAGASLSGQTDSATPFETSLGFEAGLNTTGVRGTFIGYQAGKANTTGTDNTALGHQALDANTTGVENTALGSSALGGCTTGIENVGIGYQSMLFTGDGRSNVSVGRRTLYSNTSGSYNAVVGREAMQSNTTGSFNSVLGDSALKSVTTGSNNVAIGNGALDAATTGGQNVAIGSDAMGLGVATSANAYNVAIGYQAGYDLTAGTNNFLGGYRAGFNLTTGSSNTAVGTTSASNLTTGANNVAVGNGALGGATTGGRNIAIGQDAMGLGVATAAFGDNIAIGYQAGLDLTSGNGNVLIGKGAGDDVADGSNNVLIGFDAGAAYISGSGNVAIGYRAALSATGTESVAIGQDAQRSATGTRNNSVGVQAAYSVTTGNNNVSFGYNANYSCTTGTLNTAIGNFANGVTTGSNNTLLGSSAAPSVATISNEITLGNSSVTRFRIPGIQAAAANGDVLTFDSANGIIKLQAPAGGGGLTLLSESTISSATSTVTITFPSGYRVYQLVFKNVRQNVDNESIRFQRLDSSGTAITGSTAYFYSSHDTSTTVTSSTGASFWQVNPSGIRPYTTSQAYAGLNFNFVFWGVRESTDYMAGIGEGTYLGASAVANIKLRMSATTAEQNNGIRMQSENGSSFTSGTILLYGVA